MAVKLTERQQAVVENRGGSLLVSAAAGSGKTKVLVERLFRYIREERCNVDDFLIITYTKAAAAELRAKIASELAAQLALTPGDAHLRRQLLRVYQADIKTVDAFCTGLLRENVHLLADEKERNCLTPDFRVLDENEARLVRERVLRRTMVDFYEHLTPGGALLADTLGHGRDDEKLTALVLELFDKVQSHAYPDRWLAESGSVWQPGALERLRFDETPYAAVLLEGVGRKAAYWASLLDGACGQMAGCAPLEKGYGDRFAAVSEAFRTLNVAATGWEEARNALAAIEFPRLGAVKDADGGTLKNQLKKLWDACKEETKKLRSLLGVSGAEAMADLVAVAPAMEALMALTTEFSSAYRREKLRRNAADFSDQEHLALTLLVDGEGAPTELGEQVSARYREVLVDEYQDTNEVQNDIFRAVSDRGRNLFTVGDVKQSIYRFRLADPTIFLRKYRAYKPDTEAGEGEERKILLSQNFRSRKEILDAANFIFESLMSPELGDMAYGADEALHFGAAYYPPREDCAPEFHLIAAESRSEENERPVKKLTAETRFVAGRIREMLDGAFPVTDGDGALRPCRPEDFAILMRSPGSRSAAFAEALAQEEIPCSFESGTDFFSTLEISVMLALLELIDNPRQDVPLIAVLRSPLLNVSPDRLAEIRGRTPHGDFYAAVEADGGGDCRRFLERLTALRLAAQDLSVEQLLWHIYNEWNVLGIFGAMEEGRQRRENLLALTEHAAKFESSGYRGLFAFVTQLRRLIDSGQAPQTRGGSVGSGVKLMSIHKSKGLEFPIVFLCDLDHGFSRQDFDSPVLVHPQLGLGPKRIDLERKIQYPTAARQALEERLRRENLSEELRILYVAMTRPKEKLILVDAMYHAEARLKKLAPLAGCPPLPEAVGGCKNYGEWLLLPLLCRPEAAALRQLAAAEGLPLDTGDTAPWQVVLHSGEDFAEAAERTVRPPARPAEAPPDLSLLEAVYPYREETLLPAKLTATQLKGRELDREIAEQAAVPPSPRPLRQPRFRQESHGLTPAERGTATHLALQFLDLSRLNAAGQVEDLRQRNLLTREQAEGVDCAALERFLTSPLAGEIRGAGRVWREYPFTLLVPAKTYEPKATSDDRILLQGIVDCCFETGDSLSVVDFKTDRVEGEALRQRAEQYRPQLEAYAYALSRVLEKPVRRRILYFLRTGETVEWAEDSVFQKR